MVKTYLLVNRVSYKYIKYVSDYIWLQIRRNSCHPTELLICEDVGSVEFELGSIVFIIGDPFKKFQKLPGVKYIFINFSVVTVLGSLLEVSFSAYRLISRKRKLLESKLDCFDYVFDYWPTQTIVLKDKFKKYNVQVGSFPVGIHSFRQEEKISLKERKYDVCFVGGMSPRRRGILDKLEKMGLRMSPTSGLPLEEVALDSKVVLNVHYGKSNHLETPRILGAYAAGSALVTEQCYGMNDVFQSGTYLSFKYSELPLNIVNLLKDSDRIEHIANKGYEWLEDVHLKRCDIEWKDILQRVEGSRF